MRVVTAPGSNAEKKAQSNAALLPAALAPGFPLSPAHDLIFHGGKTLADMSYFSLFVGGADAWDQSDIDNINKGLSDAMTDANLNNVIQQYFQTPVSCTVLGSQVLAGPAPALVTQGDAEDLIRRLFMAGTLSSGSPAALVTPDFESTIFNLMLPSRTLLNDDPGSSAGAMSAAIEGHPQAAAVAAAKASRKARAIPEPDQADSSRGLGGYHGSVHVNSMVVYYAIGVFSEDFGDGTSNGIPAFDENWKNVVATFYHELQEFRTDPDVEEANRTHNLQVIGWTSRRGEEIGDFPISEARPLSLVFQEVPLASGAGTVPVQLMYSNAVHGPEGPIPAPH